MKHLKDNCTAGHLFIGSECGLACGNCLACRCGACIKEEWNEMPHEEKYRALYKALGITIPEGFMGYSREEWAKLLKEDEHLNNAAHLSSWDMYGARFAGRANPLRPGWGLAPADIVCAYKRAVRDYIQAKK